MREIKFRAWHKKIKKLYKVTAIDFINKSATLVSEFGEVLFGVRFEDIVLEQYIELNDKNGAEIYEGDIVKYTMYIKPFDNFVVSFKVGCFTAVGKEETICLFDFHFDRTTVIGNVHENGGLVMKEQLRLENIDFRISQATTKRELLRLRGLLYNTSNYHLTGERYAYKHELLVNINERLREIK